MKKFNLNLTVLLLLGCVLISCRKNTQHPAKVNHGAITQDFSKCAFCGGYFVKFDTDTTIIYHTFQNLANFGVTDSSKFPLRATISWKPDTAVKWPNFILITKLKTD